MSILHKFAFAAISRHRTVTLYSLALVKPAFFRLLVPYTKNYDMTGFTTRVHMCD